MLKSNYKLSDPSNLNTILYHLQMHNIIIIKAKEEIVIFIKSNKNPHVLYYHYHKVFELEWMYDNIKYYFEGLKTELEQTEFIYGTVHGMINRLGEIDITYI